MAQVKEKQFLKDHLKERDKEINHIMLSPFPGKCQECGYEGVYRPDLELCYSCYNLHIS